MFKRLLSLTCGIMLVLLFSQTALASQPAIAHREQALKAAKELLPEIVGDLQFEVDYRDGGYWGRKVWKLSKREERLYSYGPGGSLEIEIDADTGQLLSLYDSRYTPKSKNYASTVITKDKAREIALKFAARMQPDLISQLRLQEDNYAHNYDRKLQLGYSFYWNRIVNGVPVQDDGIGVRVDAVTGKIIRYHFRWNEEAKFPPPGKEILPEGKVTDIILEKIGLYPVYTTEPGNNGARLKMVYRLNSSAFMFDVETGKPMSLNGRIKNFNESKAYNQQFTPKAGAAGIPAQQRPVKQISPMEAQKIAEKFFKQLGYRGEVRRAGRGGISTSGYYIEHWDYCVEDDKTGEGTKIEVEIDSATGKVLGFHKWNRYQGESKKGKSISYFQARDIAEEFIRNSDLTGRDMKYVISQDINLSADYPKYSICFTRLIHGVPLEGSQIRVEVDRYTGEIVSYNNHCLPVKVPKLGPVINEETAARAFKAAKPLELCYVYQRDERYRPAGEAMLVYRIKYTSREIDACTGKPLENSGKAGDAVKKLAGHWACGPLKLLADSGLLPENNFDPGGNVTRRDGLRILAAASGYYYSRQIKLNLTDVSPNDPDIEAVKKAIVMDIIENGGTLNLDAPLTREQLAAWLVNGMGYAEVAALPIKIENNFQDSDKISKQYRNHVALAVGFGFFKGDKNGCFNPRGKVTWAELATVVVRAAPALKYRD
ncbi:putative membrane protein YkoI [Desulfohalotomaculum tongense]|uniref:YcdB/YcdC domain-containing protein n=1 Tax=Desulforadius tongensis TaxID=1216062 RepID=UPI00195C2F41|nr:YcdB/YcdC domain-containing protein [Desulforadius tongensis]MBM7854048.1 putative membrane protein YkoI [Desulforadius tongensis]